MGKTKDVSHQELMEVINSFDFGGKLEEVGIFGNGHINETYCAVFSTEAGQKRYILQKMNRRIIIQILIAPSICEIGGIQRQAVKALNLHIVFHVEQLPSQVLQDSFIHGHRPLS